MLGLAEAASSSRRSAALVDERGIVNAMVGLLATGGSTNHLIHWVAVARAPASDRLDRFRRALGAVPLLARGSTPTAAPT